MKEIEKKTINNKGYIRLVDVMGSDLTVVNAARVSYAKESFDLTEKDRKLIRFLANNDHTSPFRHAILQFEIYAPLMVARQWWKYVVGSSHLESTGDSLDGWNESSRRYITEEPTFYIPKENQWREKPENSKQGSGGYFDEKDGKELSDVLSSYVDKGLSLYEQALEKGVAPEQARLFLPAYGLYVRWYWTASLQSVMHFVNQRIEHDAQKEIQDYAKVVFEYCKQNFPISSEYIKE